MIYLTNATRLQIICYSVYVHHKTSSVVYNNRNSFPTDDILDIGHLDIDVETIVQSILMLDMNWTPGPAGLPSAFFKMCAYALSFPLKIIFNKSLKSGTFPSLWKIADVIPIHKGGTKTAMENYRGISILPTLSKVFESIVTNILTQSVKHIVIDEQHGFMSGRSTTTNLMEFSQYLIEHIEHGTDVDCVYTDIKKAFDRVNIVKLIHKLKRLGITDPLLSWINSYLTDRKQKVKLCHTKSRLIDVPSGVPQGSHLGPVLFILFINDVKSIFKHCRFLLSADDLKI